MILIPFGLLLVSGIFTAEPVMRILLILADIALIVLVVTVFKKRTKWTTLIETSVFFLLLAPLLKIFFSFSFAWFNYFLFLFPTGCFLIFFPLSILLSYRNTEKKI
jgi:hypothetical protein